MYFQPYDELLYVCDTETDGHHPEGDYAAEAGDYKRGAAYYGGAGGCLIIDLALPEGSWIEYRARNVEGSTTLSTGPTIKDYA